MIYRKVNFQTKEIRQGSFEDLANLDTRVWGYAEEVLSAPPIDPEPVVLVPAIVAGRYEVAGISIHRILHITTKAAMLVRLADRQARKSKDIQREILFRKFNINHWAISPY